MLILPTLTSKRKDGTTPGFAEISYGAQYCNSTESINHADERYFLKPMIEIDLYNIEANKDPEPDYYTGYRAVYNLDGELVLEEGSWFIDQDKDEFCNHYLDIMLEIIGKQSNPLVRRGEEIMNVDLSAKLKSYEEFIAVFKDGDEKQKYKGKSLLNSGLLQLAIAICE